MGLSAAAEAFDAHRISAQEFGNSATSIIQNENLVIRFRGGTGIGIKWLQYCWEWQHLEFIYLWIPRIRLLWNKMTQLGLKTRMLRISPLHLDIDGDFGLLHFGGLKKMSSMAMTHLTRRCFLTQNLSSRLQL